MIDTYREMAVEIDNEEVKEESHYDERATGEIDFMLMLNTMFFSRHSRLLLGNEGFTAAKFAPAISSLYRMSLRDNFHIRATHEATHLQFLVTYMAELLHETKLIAGRSEPFDPYDRTNFKLRCAYDMMNGTGVFYGYEEAEDYKDRGSSVDELAKDMVAYTRTGEVSRQMLACFPPSIWRELA